MTNPKFIHLHVHSAYSLLEGALPVKTLIKLAAADAQPALAVTDRKRTSQILIGDRSNLGN